MLKIWNPILGYEGLYEISNYGEVFSILKNKIITPEVIKGKYLRIGLTKNGVRKRYLVHRLVLCNFVEHREYPEYEVNHKDFNPKNNRVDNLEWVTQQENINYSLKVGCALLPAMKESGRKLGNRYWGEGVEASKKPVGRYSYTGNLLKKYNSAREASLDGYNYKSISKVCRGERQTHAGFKWEFI